MFLVVLDNVSMLKIGIILKVYSKFRYPDVIFFWIFLKTYDLEGFDGCQIPESFGAG